jgi:hypothetical protein
MSLYFALLQTNFGADINSSQVFHSSKDSPLHEIDNGWLVEQIVLQIWHFAC